MQDELNQLEQTYHTRYRSGLHQLLCTVVALVGLLLLSFNSEAQIEREIKAPVLSSEAPVLRFGKLGIDDGLIQNSVNSIIQDRNGFIWMGTQTGLHRYDGYEFKIFTSDPFDTTSLLAGSIYSISESQNGDIWVTTDGGLNRLNPTTGKAVHYQHNPDDPNSISTNEVRKVLEGSNGDLWVATWRSGLQRMRSGEDGIFTKYLHDPDDTTSLPFNVVLDIAKDQEGHIWVATPNGISRIYPESNSIRNYMYVPGHMTFRRDSSNIRALYIPSESQKDIWVATSYGLARLDRDTGKYERFLIEPEARVGDYRNLFKDVSPDPNDPNIIWVVIGRFGGIARFDIRTRQFTRYKHDPKDKNSLSGDNINELLLDRSGMMWVATENYGANKFNPGAVNFSHIKHDPENPSSLAPGFVWGIYEDKVGSLWVSTVANPRCLTQFDAKSGLIIKYQHDPDDFNTLIDRRFNVFAEDDRGGFWVGGPGGLNLLDRTNGKVTRFLRDANKVYSGRDNITGLDPVLGDSSKLWVGSFGGLDLLDTRTGVYTKVPLSRDTTVQAPPVFSFLQDSQGSLWISTSLGLMELNSSGQVTLKSVHNQKDTTSISNNSIKYMFERRREPGILWLAMDGGVGLDRFDTQTGVVIHITKEDGLPSNQVYGILEDDQGSLWMSTNNGICNYDPDTRQIRNYGLNEGLMALEYNSYSFTKGKNGRMYFGNADGVTVFTPELLRKNEIPPQIVITDVKLFGKSIIAGTDAALLAPSSNQDKLILEFDQNELTIDFVALHFGNPEMNQYAYQLEGFDDDWVDAGTKRSTTYTNLPPGNFTFRVRASNADGVWNEQGASFVLRVLPPWYRTWWAYSIFGLVFIGGIFIVDRIQRKRLLQKERERTQQKELEQAREIEKAYKELEIAHSNLKSTQTQLIQSEKMASLGELTAGIAHEIQNPLNFVNNFSDVNKELAEELREEIKKGKGQEAEAIIDDIIENEEKIIHHGQRADSIVKGMLQHSRKGGGEKEPTDINELADEYLRLAYHGLRAKDKFFNADFKTELDPKLPKVRAVPQDIGRVLLNLINNAFYAVSRMSEAGSEGFQPTVTVSTKHVPLGRGIKGEEGIEIGVKDNGPGIPDDVKDKIFQPFFTTKATGEGTGLGLSLSYDIITKGHGGELKIENSGSEGTTFLIILPA